jgi:hypothetical protein
VSNAVLPSPSHRECNAVCVVLWSGVGVAVSGTQQCDQSSVRQVEYRTVGIWYTYYIRRCVLISLYLMCHLVSLLAPGPGGVPAGHAAGPGRCRVRCPVFAAVVVPSGFAPPECRVHAGVSRRPYVVRCRLSYELGRGTGTRAARGPWAVGGVQPSKAVMGDLT